MNDTSTYSDVNDRLKEIAEAVSDETLPLDDALDLFEEAVKLGMEASTMMEEDMAQRDAQAETEELAADAAFEAAISDELPQTISDEQSQAISDEAAMEVVPKVETVDTPAESSEGTLE